MEISLFLNNNLLNFGGYIDPGTGSMVIATIISAFVGIGLTFKMYWYKIKEKLNK